MFITPLVHIKLSTLCSLHRLTTPETNIRLIDGSVLWESNNQMWTTNRGFTRAGKSGYSDKTKKAEIWTYVFCIRVILLSSLLKYKLEHNHSTWRSWSKTGAGSFCDSLRPNIYVRINISAGIRDQNTYHINKTKTLWWNRIISGERQNMQTLPSTKTNSQVFIWVHNESRAGDGSA